MFAPVYGSYSNIAGKQEEIEMFDKLEDLLIRLEEILSELQEPDVASDPNRFRKLMKEQSELTPIVEAYKEYKACKQNIEESLELLDEESDEDMRELAKEELNESKARVEELEHELKILLLPKDPNDDKNVVVEIRAGAGGDEAALFAAEIYRMYLHYAESKRWKVELVECEDIYDRWTGRIFYDEIRIRSTPRAACAGDRKWRTYPHINNHSSSYAGGRRCGCSHR